MTVKELRDKLSVLPGDLSVVVPYDWDDCGGEFAIADSVDTISVVRVDGEAFGYPHPFAHPSRADEQAQVVLVGL